MPPIDLRQARSEIRLAVVLELLGWRARERSGEQVRGPCPVHRSSSPGSRSLSAHLGRNVWRCFVCTAQGNALDLWARATGQPLYPAVLELYRQLGRAVPWLERPRPPAAKNDKRGIRHARD
jgi:DNA primase